MNGESGHVHVSRAASTRVATFKDASPPVTPSGDVVALRLGDGSTMRATTALVRELMACPHANRWIAYDMDAAGNRYNARMATGRDHAAATFTRAVEVVPSRRRVRP